MRIVAGEWRGRKIDTPPGKSVRPTLDRVREAWMSILSLDLPGARVADLFAGSGALGIEALSRGAISAEFVESDPKAITILRKNIASLHAEDRAKITKANALQFAAKLEEGSFDIVFADPPYATGGAAQLAEIWLSNRFTRVLSVEHDSKVKMPEGGETRQYGTASITFYR